MTIVAKAFGYLFILILIITPMALTAYVAAEFAASFGAPVEVIIGSGIAGALVIAYVQFT